LPKEALGLVVNQLLSIDVWVSKIVVAWLIFLFLSWFRFWTRMLTRTAIGGDGV